MAGLCGLALAACGLQSSHSRQSPEVTTPNLSTLTSRINSHCTDLPATNLGAGSLCIDTGFRATRDGFTFANWGRSPQADQNVTIQTLVDLFGHNAVCIPGPSNACVMRPRTEEALNEWNAALAGGRCEGLAALSVRMFLGIDTPTDFDSAAATAASLKKSPSLTRAVVYWWATQFLSEVAQPAAQSRLLTPLQLVDELIQGLAHGTGYTLGLYTETTGHAVTPFAVTKRNKYFVVHVYDNNFPGMRREVLVDSASNKWFYAENVADAQVDWSGGTGTFELTPMAPRQGPFTCPFCNDTASDSGTTITYAPQDPTTSGTFHIETNRGAITVEGLASGGVQISNSVSGATVTSSKTGTSGMVTVHLPSSVTSTTMYSVTPTDVQMSNSLVTIRQPGHSDIQVNGPLSSRHAIVIDQTKSLVTAPMNQSLNVSVVAGSQLSHTTLSNGQEMNVRSISSTQIEVSLKGSASTQLATVGAAENARPSSVEIGLNDSGQLTRVDSPASVLSVSPSGNVHSLTRHATPHVSTTVAGQAPSVEIVASD